MYIKPLRTTIFHKNLSARMSSQAKAKREEKAAILRKLATLRHKLASKKRKLAASHRPQTKFPRTNPVSRRPPVRAPAHQPTRPTNRGGYSAYNPREYTPKPRTNGPTPATPLHHESTSGSVSKGQKSTKDSQGAKPFEGAAVDNQGEEETGLPCSNWPQCRFRQSCNFSHPTPAQLLKRDPGPARLDDIVSLIKRFKNNTAPLKIVHSLIGARIIQAAKIRRTRPLPQAPTRDNILALMGLPTTRKTVIELGKAGTDGKLTSYDHFSKKFGCYFAILKKGKEFLIRYYILSSRSPTRQRKRHTDDLDLILEMSGPSILDSKGRVSFRIQGTTDQADVIAWEKSDSNLLMLTSAKLPSTNKGYSILQKMGWRDGQGLGAETQGGTEPVPIRFTLTRGF